MSDEKVQEADSNVLQEVQKVVAITPEDCSGAADFWTHFEVPMPSELRAAFDNFARDPSWANQQEVKRQVVKAIGYTDHEAFKDEMFSEIVDECKNVSYGMGFDLDLEKVLTTEEDDKK